MKAEYLRAVGWLCLGITVIIAYSWSSNESGFAGWFIGTSEKLFGVRLVQIGWLLTFILLCLPGYIAKRYFDALAWNKHFESMPKPDIRDSAKRSKYVKVDEVTVRAATPVTLADVPKDQQEFIATCAGCGHLFPAKRVTSSVAIKCPNCGESVKL